MDSVTLNNYMCVHAHSKENKKLVFPSALFAELVDLPLDPPDGGAPVMPDAGGMVVPTAIMLATPVKEET